MATVHILVVEDDVAVVKAIQEVLETFGYAVPAIACSGKEAIQKIMARPPDLVLMDIRLRGAMDGVEAAEQIRSRFNIPVVYLTAYMDAHLVQRAVLTEPFGYIRKPFENRELHTIIELALYKHKMEMKVKESEQWLATILKSIGDAVIAIDTNECVTFMNPVAEALIGVKQKDAVGRNLTESFKIINAQRQPLPHGSLMAALRQGVVVDMAKYTRLLVEGRTETFIESSAAPIKDDKGNISGAVLVFRDITERKRAEEGRTRLIERVMGAQEEERRRIAQDLHDETGQSLASLLVGLRLIEDVHTLTQAKAQAKQLRHLTAQILENLGRLARGLHPSILDDLGLGAALTRYATEYAQACGVIVNIQTQGLDERRLPPSVETALYRIVQEALTNVTKHAAAKTVSIVLTRQPWEVEARVADDGCGFDVDTTLRTSAATGHLGLYGMCERAALLGGSVTIKSQPGKGTTVAACIPLEVTVHQLLSGSVMASEAQPSHLHGT